MKRKRSLQIETGYCCNNNCIFCMENRFKNDNDKNLIFYKEIAQKNSDKYKEICLVSKEPTLNKKFIEIITILKKKFNDISIVTNGRMFSYNRFLEKAINKGLNKITISIHGHTKELHESQTRAKDSFEQTKKALENINQLRKSPIKKQIKEFTINVTITKLNLKYIEDIYDFLIKFNPNNIIFNVFNPIQKAKDKTNILMPKYSNIEVMLHNMLLKGKNKFGVSHLPLCAQNNLVISNSCTIEDATHYENNDDNRQAIKPSDIDMIKLDFCNQCEMNEMCAGIPKEYIKLYGIEEFKPIKLEN